MGRSQPCPSKHRSARGPWRSIRSWTMTINSASSKCSASSNIRASGRSEPKAGVTGSSSSRSARSAIESLSTSAFTPSTQTRPGRIHQADRSWPAPSRRPRAEHRPAHSAEGCAPRSVPGLAGSFVENGWLVQPVIPAPKARAAGAPVRLGPHLNHLSTFDQTAIQASRGGCPREPFPLRSHAAFGCCAGMLASAPRMPIPG